jgi:endonuclease/exonuclease/phosphatase family metal-dependent hydrolase
MKSILKCIILTGFLAILSCGKDEESAAPVLTVNRSEVRFETGEQLETHLTVTSNRSVTVLPQATWCRAEIIKDLATDNLKISVEANETGTERTTTILLKGDGVEKDVTITVIQPSKIILTVDKPIIRFDDNKQSDTFLTVTGNIAFAVQSSDISWCNVLRIENAATNNLKISVNSNTAKEERTATISLTGDGMNEPVTVTVIQTGRPFLNIDRAVATFGSDKQLETYLTVTGNRTFSVSSQSSWCEAELIENVETDNLKISVSSNETGIERTATVLLTGDEITKTVTVIQAGITTELNVMTFNISVKDAIWDGGRNVLVKRTIIKNNVDIVGTQETGLQQQFYLNDNLIGYQSIGVASSTGSNNGESNSIFFKQVRFEQLGSSGKFWLSETPNVPGSKSWDSQYIRMAVWVRLKDKVTGKQYFVINSHIDHKGVVTAQQKQVEVLLQKIEELRDGLPVILTGDFNMRPENPNIIAITNSSLTLAHTRDVATTKDGLEYSYHGNGDTPSNERYLADYIFVSDDFEVNYYSVLPAKLDGEYVSDHAPVFAKLRVKN